MRSELAGEEQKPVRSELAGEESIRSRPADQDRAGRFLGRTNHGSAGRLSAGP